MRAVSHPASTHKTELLPSSGIRGRMLLVTPRRAQIAALIRLLRGLGEIGFAVSTTGLDEYAREGGYDILILDAAEQPLSILNEWRPLFQLPIPVLIVHAPDEAFMVAALHSGAGDVTHLDDTLRVVIARAAVLIQRSQYERAYRAKLQEMALTSQMQERFYRIVSHDLKGPLTNLRMAHYLLRDIFPDDAEAHEVLVNAEMSLNEMQEMVRVFLDVGAAQPGKIDLMIDCIDPVTIVTSVIRQYGLVAARKGIQVETQLADGLIFADSRLMTHIVSNLLSNAIKYSALNSLIRITLSHHDHCLRFAVHDSGPGVPENERADLFQPFSRLSAKPTAEESSTGLGLWIVKHLTEMQRGRVGVEFPASGGSRFYVDLPTCAGGE